LAAEQVYGEEHIRRKVSDARGEQDADKRGSDRERKGRDEIRTIPNQSIE
jgi:hypothetical protein